MPVVATWDYPNRRIILDTSIQDNEWSPLDVYKEYLADRRDTEQSRGYEPLIIMKGGEPKGGGKFAARFLQMLTDTNGVLTKFILPNNGPYRTLVGGEIATDNPDVDAEPFDTSNLTTAVIIDYKPVETEIVTIGGGAGATAQEIRDAMALGTSDTIQPGSIDEKLDKIKPNTDLIPGAL